MAKEPIGNDNSGELHHPPVISPHHPHPTGILPKPSTAEPEPGPHDLETRTDHINGSRCHLCYGDAADYDGAPPCCPMEKFSDNDKIWVSGPDRHEVAHKAMVAKAQVSNDSTLIYRKRLTMGRVLTSTRLALTQRKGLLAYRAPL